MALTIISWFNIQHTKNIIQAEYIFTVFVRHEIELNVKDFIRKLHLLLFYGELTMLKQRTYRSRSLEPAVFSANISSIRLGWGLCPQTPALPGAEGCFCPQISNPCSQTDQNRSRPSVSAYLCEPAIPPPSNDTRISLVGGSAPKPPPCRGRNAVRGAWCRESWSLC